MEAGQSGALGAMEGSQQRVVDPEPVLADLEALDEDDAGRGPDDEAADGMHDVRPGTDRNQAGQRATEALLRSAVDGAVVNHELEREKLARLQAELEALG